MKILTIVLSFVITVSCSSINKMAIKSSSVVLKEGGKSLYEESDFDIFEASVVSSIKTLEAVYYYDNEQKILNELLVKSYGALAYGLYETTLLGARLSESEDESDFIRKTQQIYSRAIFYGLEYIKRKGLSEKVFFKLKNREEFSQYFDEDDKITLFYFAQSLGGMLNLDLANLQLVEKSASIALIMDWVCYDQDDFELGACELFDASYDAVMPRMLGGKPERSAEKFKALMTKYPENLLIQMNYIEYVVIPSLDEKLFEKQIKSLTTKINIWDSSLVYPNDSKEIRSFRSHKEFNLFNSITKRRLEILKENRTNIF